MDRRALLPLKNRQLRNLLQIVKDMKLLAFLLLLVLGVYLFVPLSLDVLRLLMVAGVACCMYVFVKRHAVYIAAETC